MTVHGFTTRSHLTGCQVRSRARDRFSRYSKWLDTLWTALVFLTCQVTIWVRFFVVFLIPIRHTTRCHHITPRPLLPKSFSIKPFGKHPTIRPALISEMSKLIVRSYLALFLSCFFFTCFLLSASFRSSSLSPPPFFLVHERYAHRP